MSDRCDRDRVTAILTLADAAMAEPWVVTERGGSYPTDDGTDYWLEVLVTLPDPRRDLAEDIICQLGDDEESKANAAFIAASRSETPWLARRLLEALDTIERVNALFAGGPDTACRTVWDGEIECVSVPIEDLRQALNGGNE